MAGEINRINPTVVEGAEDIHGAESFDADYSPLNRPSFSWRDNMAQSRRTLDEKQVGDMMRVRRMGRGRYDAETFEAQAGSGGILYDDDNNGSMVLKKGWTWLEGSTDNEDYYGNCDSCRNELDAYYTGYVVDGTEWSICIECFDKMPGREGVIIEHKNGNRSVDFKNTYNAEETFNAPLSREEVEKLRRKMSYAKGSRPSMRPVENRLAVGQRMKGSMASEGFSDVLGTLIPQPHFIGIEELRREGMKNRDAKDAESCGNCGSALVMNAEGEHGCGCGTEMEAEETMLGSIGEGNDFGQMEAEEFGAERRYRYGNRYITRDSKGRFKKNVSVGRSLSADRRRKAKTVKGVGQGGKGDYGAEGFNAEGGAGYLVCTHDGCYNEENLDTDGWLIYSSGYGGHEVLCPTHAPYGAVYLVCTYDGCREEENIDDDGWYLGHFGQKPTVYCPKHGREEYPEYYNAEEFNTEETSLGLIGEGNDFGQMEAEENYYTRDATFVCPESDCGCRGCYGCMGEDENPNCRCCGYVFKDGPTGMGEHTTYQCSCGVRACDGCIGEDDPTCPSCGIVFVHTTGPFDEQGNYIGGAEGDVVDLTQGVLAKGGVRVGGMTASAIVLAIAGLSGYYYARR